MNTNTAQITDVEFSEHVARTLPDDHACEWINSEDAEKFRVDCKTAPMTDDLAETVEFFGGYSAFRLNDDGVLDIYRD